MKVEIAEHRTPLGDVTAAWRDERLCALTFSEYWAQSQTTLARRLGAIELAATRAGRARLWERLDAYFAGELAAIDAVAVAPHGTAFQRAVWTALRRIPVGSTCSYSDLAQAVGSPTAVRAVGAANGANPIWLLIPCHRAIGADGSLTGYAGGLQRKRWLLEHEGALKNSPQRHRGTEKSRTEQPSLF
ncbi:MAG: methylated-DNA--[protein]-cysteine S-methyltransferase [Deltaproteobacteria bacterium]|nr:methylated-DNA--[protein]-cysteine S-methyltransferase [Deltaproteobacteria bacterium]